MTCSKTASSLLTHRRVASFCLVAFVVTAAPVVSAAPAETDRTLAQSLFEDGRRLMTEGDYEAACPKLEESQRLDASGGTVLNLALCREQQGQLATASRLFKQALSSAQRDNRPDRAQAAESHLAALEGKVPWIKLKVAAARPDQEVLVDGVLVREPAWGTKMSLDPGKHEVTARAPGMRDWAQTLDLAVGVGMSVEVPALHPGDQAGDAGGPPPSEAEQTASGGSSTLGWVLGGVGLAAIGVGSVFGVQALSKQNKAEGECPTHATCSKDGEEYMKQANTAAWISNISIGTGLVAVGVGTYLLLTSGSAPPKAARRVLPLRVDVASDRASVAFQGAF
jgi:hypothetical protein